MMNVFCVFFRNFRDNEEYLDKVCSSMESAKAHINGRKGFQVEVWSIDD